MVMVMNCFVLARLEEFAMLCSSGGFCGETKDLLMSKGGKSVKENGACALVAQPDPSLISRPLRC